MLQHVAKAGRPAAVTALAVAAALMLPAVPSVVASNAKRALLRGPHQPASSASWPSDVPRRLQATRALPAFVPGHIVAKFDGAASARSVERMAREVGAVGVWRPSYADFSYLELAADIDAVKAASALAGMPGVLYAEPDPILRSKFRPNDPLYRLQSHLQKLDMERAWDINPGASSDTVVAVLDTGVAFLDSGAFARAPDLNGTHVTGTVAQTTDNAEGVAGMAFNVSVMPVKVIFGEWDFRLGAPFSGASTLARGIRFAVDNGATVLNMSLGGYSPSTPTLEAMRYAVDRGAFMAIAAGNEAVFCNGCPPGIGPNPVEYPAKYAEEIDGAMAVAALDFNLERSSFSNIHSYVEIAAPGGDFVDLNRDGFEDGVLQQTLDPDFTDVGIFSRFSYVFFQGTSQATPHVAGFAAQLMSQGIRSPVVIEAAIKRFATDIAPLGRDPFTGYGVVNPRTTLLGLGLAR